MKWLFNGNLLTVKNGKVSWEQARAFKGEKGDEVIFFDFAKGDGNFTSLYRIEEISAKQQSGKLDSRFDIEVILVEEKNYKDDIKEFADYVYSFPRVKNFGSNLWRHFNRKYYRISELEFNAITKDEIFLSRTFLGSTINALHQDHRRAFVIYLNKTNPEYLFGKHDYQHLYELLQKYLDFAIIRPSRQLQSGFTDLLTITGRPDANEAIFGSELTKNSHSINAQIEVIDSRLEIVESLATIDFPVQVRQEKFEKYFKNASLPFNLN